MAGNIKISELNTVESANVQGSAYFPFSDKFGEDPSFTTKKMSLDQIAAYVNTAYTNAEKGFGVGVCYTSSGDELDVDLPDYEKVKDGFVAVTFAYDVPANAKLNINSKGSTYIYYKDEPLGAYIIKAEDTILFGYDGENYTVASISGGDEVEVSYEQPTTEDVKIWIDEDDDPGASLDVYTKQQVDAKLAFRYDPTTKGMVFPTDTSIVEYDANTKGMVFH